MVSALVQDIKTESIAKTNYPLLITFYIKFDIAEIKMLLVSCIQVWDAHFTCKSSIFFVLVGWAFQAVLH